ncbi:MAG: hypothetical protein OEW22_05960 [Rubrivivax sp.]|nr:hypothetical protein [Rubrivivax sp.]
MPMQAKTVEKLAWVLIYSGLLLACLGLFLRPAQAMVGLTLIGVGLLDAAAGVGLIYWRSRMPQTDTSPKEKR